jgi:hypothetical protein
MTIFVLKRVPQTHIAKNIAGKKKIASKRFSKTKIKICLNQHVKERE